MTTVEIDMSVRTVRVLAEVDELKDFWASFPTHRDADFDFYLFYLRNSPEVVRPHVIVLYRDGRPHAMLVGRLEKRGVDIRFGYIRLIRLRLRALTFMYGGVLGDISLAAVAKDVISCIEESLRAGEADAAFLEYLPLDSPLHGCARSLPNPVRVNHFAESRIHRIRTLANGKSFIESLSSHERNNQKRRARRLAESFGDRVRIECFQDASTLQRLMEHAESIAEKSYQRGLGVGFTNTPKMRKRLELEARKTWLRAHILYLNDQPYRARHEQLGRTRGAHDEASPKNLRRLWLTGTRDGLRRHLLFPLDRQQAGLDHHRRPDPRPFEPGENHPLFVSHQTNLGSYAASRLQSGTQWTI